MITFWLYGKTSSYAIKANLKQLTKYIKNLYYKSSLDLKIQTFSDSIQ